VALLGRAQPFEYVEPEALDLLILDVLPQVVVGDPLVALTPSGSSFR
jgi:hypothetical protein